MVRLVQIPKLVDSARQFNRKTGCWGFLNRGALNLDVVHQEPLVLLPHKNKNKTVTLLPQLQVRHQLRVGCSQSGEFVLLPFDKKENSISLISYSALILFVPYLNRIGCQKKFSSLPRSCRPWQTTLLPPVMPGWTNKSVQMLLDRMSRCLQFK